ncbi:hypothetical protein BKA67DRAFT_673967 [Truncatella angustata]|uniref:Uncharacterized protein n=1 Tax=Truncatella angustata TaxID=152316 RepID=A0A9P8UTL8_9PEZI|nr:uncharacterized protein BKA67DRAFT_673967 [Truncatella angustata]KAH6658123.1 hypothetical protein BKA67DRAFT_673967 [Truncatella angustata]
MLLPLILHHRLLLLAALTALTLTAHADVSDCFYLAGTAGSPPTNLYFSTISQPPGSKLYQGTFTRSLAQATLFGIPNRATGRLRAYATGNNINGRTATLQAAGPAIVFDTKTAYTLGGRAPLRCGVAGPANELGCAAGDGAGARAFQLCSLTWAVVGRPGAPLSAGCRALTMTALEASGCGNYSIGVDP